jgi:hypothetical protein
MSDDLLIWLFALPLVIAVWLGVVFLAVGLVQLFRGRL